MSDPDGDSQMRASSSEDDDSDAMFPAANEPAPTGLNPTISNLLASPPPSQDPADAISIGDDVMDFTENANANIGGNGSDQTMRSAGVAGSAEGSQKSLNKTGNSVKEEDVEKQPGYAWKNKKARDEYQRALEQVVDRNFNLREFGDPFDESVTSEEGALGQ